MSVCLDQVLDYLDHHPICYYADDVESLLGMLYDVYAKHNTISSAELECLWKNMEAALCPLPADQKEHCLALIHDWRREHEPLAFIHGFIVGLNLITEIRTVT